MTQRPRVLVVIGTRPEGIKLAPVVHALLERDATDVAVALTGQHTTLMDQVLRVFELPVNWDLGIMREGQSLYDVAHGSLDGLRGVVREYRPDIILVQGDTASVFFGALVGFFERTLVGHVEAGLRSRDKWRPYPEEIFRRMTGVVADLHFAPTAEAIRNLTAENVPREQLYLTGNTVVDALESVARRNLEPGSPALRDALASGKRLVLVTAHRRESFGAPLREALRAVRTLADRFADTVFFYPVHPNPEVRSAATEVLSDHPGVVLTDPLDYVDLTIALKRSTIVLTDSGGIQEEAPTFGVPILVLREVSERPEGIHAGVAALVGTDYDRIVELGSALLSDEAARRRMSASRNPYGDGRAGERIADVVIHRLTGAPRRTTDWETA